MALGASARGAASLVLDAARAGIDLYGWDGDWAAARVFLAGISDERCGSVGPLEGLK